MKKIDDIKKNYDELKKNEQIIIDNFLVDLQNEIDIISSFWDTISIERKQKLLDHSEFFNLFYKMKEKVK